jgi:hypothetical protein
MAGGSNTSLDFQHYKTNWSEDLELLRQNSLMTETEFINFAQERGIPVSGVNTGDPGDFNRRGWLPHDHTRPDGSPLFHPFRLYTMHKILEACRLNISVSSSLNRQTFPGFVERVAREFMPTIEKIGAATTEWNRITDLVVLLEPVYWPEITGQRTMPVSISDDEYGKRLHDYRQKTDQLVSQLNVDEWKKYHEQLRICAAIIDRNDDLYLLLRVSKWSIRQKLKGRAGAALWIRHIAEVLRLAFEEVHKLSWPEEDCAFGQWFQGARTVAYGSERPLDDVLHSRPHIAFNFGLSTGSVVRWYVEGDTEYHAILRIISEPAKFGIELVNLRGNIAIQKGNIALKLSDGLKDDLSLRRFSFISFDTDVNENVKFIQQQLRLGNIVGFIAAHRPDFEFENFTLDELVEIAACMDEVNGYSGSPVRDAIWTDVTCSREFEQHYLKVSARRPAGLKGKGWGIALAEYMDKHPERADNQNGRPFWRELSAAVNARAAHYDLQKQDYLINPNTFEIERNDGRPR